MPPGMGPRNHILDGSPRPPTGRGTLGNTYQTSARTKSKDRLFCRCVVVCNTAESRLVGVTFNSSHEESAPCNGPIPNLLGNSLVMFLMNKKKQTVVSDLTNVGRGCNVIVI